MWRSSLSALWLTTILVAALPAQPPPDFSGQWPLVAPAIASTPAVPGTPAAAAAPGDMGSGWGSAIAITQDAKQLSVEYAVFSRYDLQPPLTFTYALDGSESRNTVMMGRGEQTEASRARRDGQALIIVTTRDRASGVALDTRKKGRGRVSRANPALVAKLSVLEDSLGHQRMDTLGSINDLGDHQIHDRA